jgi:hypothetical protein
MALTEAEQKELDSLNAQASPVGLTTAEQKELDALNAGAQKPTEQLTPEERQILGMKESTVENALKTFPVMGMTAGALATGALELPTSGLATLAGPAMSAGGAVAGQSLADTLRTALKMKSAPQTAMESLVERPLEAASTGAMAEFGGQAAGGTLSLAKKGLQSLAKNPPAQVEAAKALLYYNYPHIYHALFKGAKAIPLATGGEPGFIPQSVQDRTAPEVQNILSEQSQKTPAELASQVKEGLKSEIGKKAFPIETSFNEVAQVTGKLPTNDLLVSRASDSILNTKAVQEFPQSEAAKQAKQVVSDLENQTTVDGIKRVNTRLNEVIADKNIKPSDKQALVEISGKLKRLEYDHVLQAFPEMRQQLEMPIENVGQTTGEIPTTVVTKQTVPAQSIPETTVYNPIMGTSPGVYQAGEGTQVHGGVQDLGQVSQQVPAPPAEPPATTQGVVPREAGYQTTLGLEDVGQNAGEVPVPLMTKKVIPGKEIPETANWTPHQTTRTGVVQAKPGFQTESGLSVETPKGTDTLAQLKQARNQWANLLNGLRQIVKAKGGLPGVKSKIDSMEVDKFINKMFTNEKLPVLKQMEQQFPEQYQTMREYKIGQIANKSKAANGDIDPQKLSNNIGKLRNESPEIFDILFGGKGKSLEGLQKELDNIGLDSLSIIGSPNIPTDTGIKYPFMKAFFGVPAKNAIGKITTERLKNSLKDSGE